MRRRELKSAAFSVGPPVGNEGFRVVVVGGGGDNGSKRACDRDSRGVRVGEVEEGWTCDMNIYISSQVPLHRPAGAHTSFACSGVMGRSSVDE